MLCAFCRSAIDDEALVCPACRRDVVVPPALLAERDNLVSKRDQLAKALASIEVKLTSPK